MRGHRSDLRLAPHNVLGGPKTAVEKSTSGELTPNSLGTTLNAYREQLVMLGPEALYLWHATAPNAADRGKNGKGTLIKAVLKRVQGLPLPASSTSPPRVLRCTQSMYGYDAPKPCALEDSDTTSTSGAASDEEHLNDTRTDDEHSTDAGSVALAMSRVYPFRCNKLNFEGENFTMHASLLPERYHLAASELMSACTLVNHGLLSSFLYLLCLCCRFNRHFSLMIWLWTAPLSASSSCSYP